MIALGLHVSRNGARIAAARRRFLHLLLLVLLAAGGGACADSAGEEAVLLRLIDSTRDTGGSLAPRTDLSLKPTWQAKIAAAADLPAWSFYVPSAPAALAASGGVDLGPLAGSQYLVWTGRLEAGNVDVLHFRFQEPLPLEGLVELYWNGEGQDFAPQRYLLQSPDPQDPRQVAFEPGDSRHWRGTVTRIGLRLLNQPLSGQALLEGEGLGYVAAEGLGDGETKYVVLDGRRMPAWLARPGFSVRRQLTVPRNARLRLHAAPWLSGQGRMGIKIVAQSRFGSQVLVERELRQQPNPPRRRWDRIEADLRPFAGETIELLFEAGAAPPGSLVAWGNPQILGTAGESRPNVVFISLDTVRADHLSLYGYKRPTTPHMDAWAGRWATVFETTVATAPWTLPSHVSMFSGIDSVHHGVNRHGPIPPSLTLIPQRFRDAGYATYATTAGVLLTPELGFARGFDEFRVRGKMESLPEWDAELGTGITDALRWLEARRGERFFLFLHTFEAHSPYQAREPYFSRFGGDPKSLNAGQPVWMEAAGFDQVVRPLYLLFHPPTYAEGVTYSKRVLQPQDREVLTALYDSGLAYIDRQLSRLFEYLESEGLLENTVVVITSDHGESLFEHGLVGHSSLYDHDLLVPLVIAAPLDEARGRRVPEQVRSVDIAPTLLQLARLAPFEAVDGSSLVPFLRGEKAPPRDAWSYALSTTRGVSLRNGGRQLKLIAQDSLFTPFRWLLETYDLRRDPEELRNLSPGTTSDRTWQRLIQEVKPGSQALLLRVTNAGPEEFLGQIGGDTIDGMITSPDLSFPCCEATPTGIHFRTPAGASFTVVLHDRTSGTLRLRLRDTGGQIWKESFPLATMPPRMRIAWEDGRWQTTAGGEARRGSWTGIEAWREGPIEIMTTDEEEMRNRLRALGYIQ